MERAREWGCPVDPPTRRAKADLLHLLREGGECIKVGGRGRGRGRVSQPELGANRIVLNATKQAPAPQASKNLGRASHQRTKEACGSKEGASSALRPSLSLARANSLSTTSIRPEGHCQALAELAVTRAGCWLGKPGEGAHL
jgi:hypothetical protein